MTQPGNRPHQHGPFTVIPDPEETLEVQSVQCDACGEHWPKCSMYHEWEVDAGGRQNEPQRVRCTRCGKRVDLGSRGRGR